MEFKDITIAHLMCGLADVAARCVPVAPEEVSAFETVKAKIAKSLEVVDDEKERATQSLTDAGFSEAEIDEKWTTKLAQAAYEVVVGAAPELADWRFVRQKEVNGYKRRVEEESDEIVDDLNQSKKFKRTTAAPAKVKVANTIIITKPASYDKPSKKAWTSFRREYVMLTYEASHTDMSVEECRALVMAHYARQGKPDPLIEDMISDDDGRRLYLCFVKKAVRTESHHWWDLVIDGKRVQPDIGMKNILPDAVANILY
jgi:hypothetical protein